MRISANWKIRQVLEVGPPLLEALVGLAPDFERLRNPLLRKAMSNRITVEQAARMAGVPLTQVLLVLNLAAGEDPQLLLKELQALPYTTQSPQPVNPLQKPAQLQGIDDSDPRIHFLDLLPFDTREEDPLPTILRALVALEEDQILLIRHPFNPIPLRDLALKMGYASWAQEREPSLWHTYFYHLEEQPKADPPRK